MAVAGYRHGMPAIEDRRARAATTVVFFATGFVVAAWATRIPAVQERLALSPGTFAVAVLGLEGGALAGLPAGGALVARLGSRASLRLAFLVYPAALPAVADLAVLPHFVLAGGAGLLAGVAATRWLVDEPRRSRRRLLARPSGRLLLLGAVAFCAFLLDGAASNWSAAHLHGERGASPALAAAGFSAFTAAVALGRLAGDRLVDRFGRVRVVQASGLVAAAGGVTVAAAPTATLALAGWATLGAGLAAVAPAILGAVPAMATGPLPLAIAAVTTLGYLGSFTGPPLVGALAGATGLSAALWLLVAAAAVPVGLAGRALGPRAHESRQPSLR
jgi:Major Facilitator Superfamily